MLNEGIEIASRHDSVDGAVATQLRVYLVPALAAAGRLHEAQQVAQRALAHRSALRLSEQISLKLALGTTLTELGQPAEGEALLAEALRERERLAGPDSPALIEYCVAAAANRRRTGDFAGALALAERAVKIGVDRLDPANWLTATARVERGYALRALGREEEALQALRHGFEDLRTTFGDAHPSVLRLAAELGGTGE